MYKELFNRIWQDHRGRILGVSLGLLAGIIIVTMGFWKTVILALCAGIGYWIGGMTDRQERFIAFLDKILPKG
ncbi:MAG TPA: DUF2273 domain-containing protein [Clostridia bacterium]|nr:DUF2273 domain-containing protein [Clostridia bacterium]